jgi:GNAT superfamily N-acetyltransferase
VLVRTRRNSDHDALVKIAEQVHSLDGYPPYLPNHDFRDFLFEHETLAAWVAELAGELVGQVALHPRTGQSAMALAAEALGVEPERLGVVARLLVDPVHRGLGAAKTLLEVAASAAVERHRIPILDVASHFHAAVGLYERCGWVRLGEVEVPLPTGLLKEYVYLAPVSLRPVTAPSADDRD